MNPADGEEREQLKEADREVLSVDHLRKGCEQLDSILGTCSKVLQDYLIAQLASIGGEGADRSAAVSRGVAVLADIAPKTALEGLLAVQMVATHELAIEFARRARRADVLPQVTAHANLAVKLERAFVAQVEALERLRGRKTEQTVTVRHISGENVVQGDFGPVAGEDLESLIEPEGQARDSAGCGEGGGSC